MEIEQRLPIEKFTYYGECEHMMFLNVFHVVFYYELYHIIFHHSEFMILE